jgi:hypothetical protein
VGKSVGSSKLKIKSSGLKNGQNSSDVIIEEVFSEIV